MDPIEVEGPDGSVVEFPAGTDDATIQRVMAETYGGPQQGGQPAAEAQPRTGPSYGERGTFDRTWEGLSPAQIEAYKKFAEEQGGIQANQPVGTDGNPILVGPDMSDEDMQRLIDSEVTYIDRDGQFNRKAHQIYGAYRGAQRPAINALNWLEGGIGAVAGEDAKEAVHDWRKENLYYTTQESADELEQLARGAGFRAGGAGQMAGMAVTGIPAAILTRNPWVAGGVEAALNSSAQDAKGLAMDTAFGAVAGRLGEGAARAAGAVISPQIAEGTQRLIRQGVTPSPGQLLGGIAHRAEDATTGILGLGELTGGAQDRAVQSFNSGGFRRALGRVGQDLPDEGRNMTSHQMADFSQQTLDDAYADVINRLDNIRLDQDFLQDFRNLDQMASGLNAEGRDMWERLIREQVAPMFNNVPGAANGRISGQAFKDLESILGQEVRDFRASASPHDRRYSNAVRELQASLRDMAARHHPEEAGRLADINSAYRELVVLEDAVNMAREGTSGRFTPDQLGRASRNQATRRIKARNEDIFGEYADDAANLLNRTVGDSGTASRAAMTTAMAAGFFGGKIALSVNPWAVAALAAGAIPYTRQGNRLFTAAVTSRPRAITDPIREGLEFAAPYLGQSAAMANTLSRDQSRMRHSEDEAINAALDAEDAAYMQGPAADLEGLY